MNKKLIVGISCILIVVFIYLAFGYLSSFIGWYGYKKWRYRVGTTSISESKKRGLFVTELNYKVINFNEHLSAFQPYIEKGFMYGFYTSEDTRQLTNTHYPYQLSFNYRPSSNVTVTIKSDDLKKFDSADASWGYLGNPILKDTINLEINTQDGKTGIIKVWQQKILPK